MTQIQTTKMFTSCGHTFDQPEAWKEVEEGATFDCPECNNLEVLVIMRKTVTYSHPTLEPWEWNEVDIILHTQDFHAWMHNNNPSWPKDGKNTGYIDISPKPPKVCTNPKHDHKLEDNQAPGHCNDCGQLAYFDEGQMSYLHTDGTTCFLTDPPSPEQGWTPCTY